MHSLTGCLSVYRSQKTPLWRGLFTIWLQAQLWGQDSYQMRVAIVNYGPFFFFFLLIVMAYNIQFIINPKPNTIVHFKAQYSNLSCMQVAISYIYQIHSSLSLKIKSLCFGILSSPIMLRLQFQLCYLYPQMSIIINFGKETQLKCNLTFAWYCPVTFMVYLQTFNWIGLYVKRK